MPFFGIEDGFAFHPKVMAAGDAAIGVWARLGAWSMEHGTDGFIPVEVWSKFGRSRERVRLLEVGLLDEVSNGYVFHDWTQPSVETMRKRREVRAAAGRKGGIASGISRRANMKPRSNEANEAKREANAQAKPKPEDENVDVSSTYVYNAPHVGNAPARDATIADANFMAATSERGLSPPVSIGASRLVATVIRNGTVSDADRTILRIKASEALAEGRSDDDVAECLRIWLTKNDLGPHGLLCCMTQVDKHKLNGHGLANADKKALQWLALGSQESPHPTKGLPQ